MIKTYAMLACGFVGAAVTQHATAQVSNTGCSGHQSVIQEAGLAGTANKFGDVEQSLASIFYSNSTCVFNGSGRVRIDLSVTGVEEDGRRTYGSLAGVGYTHYLSQGKTTLSITPMVLAGYDWFEEPVDDQFVKAVNLTVELNQGLGRDDDAARFIMIARPEYSDRSTASSQSTTIDVDGDGVMTSYAALGIDFPIASGWRSIAWVGQTHAFSDRTPKDQASAIISFRPVNAINNYPWYIEARYNKGTDEYEGGTLSLIKRF